MPTDEEKIAQVTAKLAGERYVVKGPDAVFLWSVYDRIRGHESAGRWYSRGEAQAAADLRNETDRYLRSKNPV